MLSVGLSSGILMWIVWKLWCGWYENNNNNTCAYYMSIILMCVMLLILQCISIVHILSNNACGTNLACMMLHILKLWPFYICRSCLFAIHVWHPHFPSNGIKKYLILFCHISAKSRIVQRIPTLVCEVLRWMVCRENNQHTRESIGALGLVLFYISAVKRTTVPWRCRD